MKKVYACVVTLLLLIGGSLVCEFYVTDSIEKTIQSLENAAANRVLETKDGDFAISRAYAELAYSQWHDLVEKSNFLLADLTIVPDVTTTLSRVVTLSEGENCERFHEENTVAILLLRHFLSDNQS